MQLIPKEEIDNWLKIIEVLDQKINAESQKELKPIIIAYNILDKESEMLKQLNDSPMDDNDLEELENKEDLKSVVSNENSSRQ